MLTPSKRSALLRTPVLLACVAIVVASASLLICRGYATRPGDATARTPTVSASPTATMTAG